MAQNSHETGGASHAAGKTEPPEPTRKCSPFYQSHKGLNEAATRSQ